MTKMLQIGFDIRYGKQVSSAQFSFMRWPPSPASVNWMVHLNTNAYRKISNRRARLLDSGLGLFYFSHECSLITKLYKSSSVRHQSCFRNQGALLLEGLFYQRFYGTCMKLNTNAYMHEQTTIGIHEEEVPKLVYWCTPFSAVSLYTTSLHSKLNSDNNK